MTRNSATRYGSVARTFHWLTALLILCNVVLGLVANRLSVEAMDRKVQLFSLHKTIGIAAVIVASLRILWALSQPRPAAVHPERRAETFIAETAHWLLYVLMIAVPLAGWAEHAATEGFAPILWPFGQDLPFVPKSGHLAEVLANVHRTFAWLLIGTVALHIAGALKHGLIDKDGVLGRMVFGRAAGAGLTRHHVLPALAAAVIFAVGAGYAYVTRPTAAEAAPALAQVASDWHVKEGSVTFSVAQMGTPVQGSFADWTAAIAFDEATGTGDVTVTINMDSLTIGTVTDQAKGPAFFDVGTHPTAVFKARIAPADTGYLASGTLTMKGAEMPFDLPFTLDIADGVATMAGSTTLDRRTWAVGDGYPDETTVGFPVTINVALTAQR
ncbi:cytochrome b/b6 domain-containing protein [Falsirhodobacter sp. 20TX0035]|uniref:cytochrome b/b6 domain-containing protein n=1 Tax=Falsirhodobacter sp. 20TX0035 TaxID=3022019 RepID=UPI00233086E5|nr:cytochrome b/b6 domain-containing protein [Falsirhodobacter sp. 20TX0035]MDB6454090.1 cytochrome b/b6 domain-containing protein [Falsirhodobacter sp. 20TX0035]